MTGAGFTIRRAEVGDLPAVRALFHALVLEDAVGDAFTDRLWPVTGGEKVFDRVIENTQDEGGWECCWVAVVDGEVVGFLEGGTKGSAAWRPVKATEVRSIFVREQRRGRGIGRGLMLEFLRWSEKRGAQAVELGVFASNERGIAFYRSLGFAPTVVTMERVVRPEG